MFMDERAFFEKRRRDLRLKFYAAAGATGLILVFGFAIITQSAFFQIKEISIIGVDDAKKPAILSQIIAKKQSIYPARYLGYGNILLWSDGKIDLDIPQILEGSIGSDFSEKRIVIYIKEKVRALIWCGASGGCFWIGTDGVAIEEAPATAGSLVNLVNSSANISIGGKILSGGKFENLIKILGILKKAQLTASNMVATPEELVIFMPPGVKIYFNLNLDPAFTVIVLDKLRSVGKLQNLSYIDFRIENKAYYK